MREVDLKGIAAMADEARESIWEQAKSCGREPKIYLHWTAGHYSQYYLNDYHIAIDYDGCIYVDAPLDQVLAHTWKRNTGSVGITLACCAGANTRSLGEEPPTHLQIEMMAQVIAVLAKHLWLTINKQHVLTHGEAADNEDGLYAHEPYGPNNDCERWDLEYLGTKESIRYNPLATDGSRGGDVLRGKANWYNNTYNY